MNQDNHHVTDKLVPAYHNMLGRVKEVLPHPHFKTLRERIEVAKEKAVTLEELTIEEAERIGDYLHRDVEDAAQFIVNTGQALADWMRFDLELVEDRWLEMFSLMVDHTRVELENLAVQAHHPIEWNSGEITGPGTLYCDSCGSALHFHQPDYIPDCPDCGGIIFKREVEIEETEVDSV